MPKSEKVAVERVEIAVAGKTLILTPQEAMELRDVLAELFPKVRQEAAPPDEQPSLGEWLAEVWKIREQCVGHALRAKEDVPVPYPQPYYIPRPVYPVWTHRFWYQPEHTLTSGGSKFGNTGTLRITSSTSPGT